MAKENLSAVHFLVAFVFCISGLIINFLQAVLYITLYHINRKLYRKLNYYLIYTSWSQVVAVAEWWSGSDCIMYGDEETLKHFGKEHSIVVMNHKYDIDWLMCWLVCDKLQMLANAKTCAKTSLMYVPVFGWAMVFAEMVFLERNWEKDSLTLGGKLDRLVSYEDPILLLLFCEGTRFTPEKHKASMQFAENNNFKKLKHHLLPRPRGFNFAVSHLKNKMDAIYDIQLAFPNDSKPTFFDILRGNKAIGEMYIRRIPLKDIPTSSDEETTAWLQNLYQEKDQIMDDYLKKNVFPGKSIRIKRRIAPLLNALLWTCVVGLPFCYTIFRFLTCGVLWVQFATVTTLVLFSSAVYMFIGVTVSDKGSSYGKNDTSPKRTGDTNGTAAAAPSSAKEQNGSGVQTLISDSMS